MLEGVAGTTGLEPATSDVTGRRSNQLNYVPLQESVGLVQSNTTGTFRPHFQPARRILMTSLVPRY